MHNSTAHLSLPDPADNMEAVWVVRWKAQEATCKAEEMPDRAPITQKQPLLASSFIVLPLVIAANGAPAAS